jgi:hypothetical protein
MGPWPQPCGQARMVAMELHLESTIDRAYEPTAAALRAGPEAWLPVL